MAAPSPPPEENDRAFSTGEPAVVWRAYARQMLAILGVDNPAIEAAYAAVPREAFLGPRLGRRPRRLGASAHCQARIR